MTRIILNGCFGRMGTVLCRLAADNPDVEIVAGIDIAEHADGLTFPTYSDISNCEMPADVVVDFTNINGIRSLCGFGESHKLPLVVCTTGLTAENWNDLHAAAKKVAVFQSPNMSLGVNLLSNMLKRASKLLYDAGFDIEITERHHNQKLDAPSGTALVLAETVNAALDNKLHIITDGRSGVQSKRARDEIGVHALRGGTIVGEHSVVFAGLDEVIEFSHSAYSREVFAVGAIKAAVFLKNKPPGLYNMQDLIDEL